MGFRDNFKQAVDEVFGTGGNNSSTSVDQEEHNESAMDSDSESDITAPKYAEKAESRSLFKREKTIEKSGSRFNANVAKTVITFGTTIKGDLISQGDLDIQGAVNGNVTTDGLVCVTGKIEGNVTCENLELDNAEIRGQVSVKKQLLMRGESVVVGDLTGEHVEINGKVKGNITVVQTLHLQPKAYVLGDMNTSSIQIKSGAVVIGSLHITTASDPESVFEVGFSG